MLFPQIVLERSPAAPCIPQGAEDNCFESSGWMRRREPHSPEETLFGVRPLVMVNGGAAGEAAGIEERQVERGLAVEQPLADVAAGGGRVLEAVTAEADGDEEAFHAGRPPDDRVVVGRQRPQARPAAGDPRLLDDRNAVQRLLHRLVDARAVDRHAEILADILDVAGREQELLHLLAEVEPAGAIGRERYRPGDL